MAGEIKFVSFNRGVDLDITVFVFNLLVLLTIRFALHRGHRKHQFPDSLTLMVASVSIGAFPVFTGTAGTILDIPVYVFFLVLIPPLVLNPAFRLASHTSFFGETITLAFAIAALSVILAAVILYAARPNFRFPLNGLDALLVAAVITASDPASDLILFTDFNVRSNRTRVIVLLEAIMHTLVLSTVVNAFLTNTSLSPLLVFFMVLNCLIMASVGLAIGFVLAIIISALLKYTARIEVIEPFIVVIGAYFAFVTADVAYGSPSIALLSFVAFIREYAFPGLTPSSQRLTKDFVSGLAVFAETFIIALIGVNFASVFFEIRSADGVFIAVSLAASFAVRPLAVFIVGRAERRETRGSLMVVAVTGIKNGIAFSTAAGIVRVRSGATYREGLNAALAVIVASVTLNGLAFPAALAASSLPMHQNHSKRLSEIVLYKGALFASRGFARLHGYEGHWIGALARGAQRLKIALRRGRSKSDEIVLLRLFRKVQAADIEAKHSQFDPGGIRMGEKKASKGSFDTQALSVITRFASVIFGRVPTEAHIKLISALSP